MPFKPQQLGKADSFRDYTVHRTQIVPNMKSKNNSKSDKGSKLQLKWGLQLPLDIVTLLGALSLPSL